MSKEVEAYFSGMDEDGWILMTWTMMTSHLIKGGPGEAPYMDGNGYLFLACFQKAVVCVGWIRASRSQCLKRREWRHGKTPAEIAPGTKV